ncbi:MAG: hypothetical protein ACI4DP_06960 [Candidatus Ornithomonoglobus sp.]
MKKIFDNPEITVSVFSSEDVVTTSGLTPDSVESLLKNADSGIKLDGKSFNSEASNIMSFTF